MHDESGKRRRTLLVGNVDGRMRFPIIEWGQPLIGDHPNHFPRHLLSKKHKAQARLVHQKMLADRVLVREVHLRHRGVDDRDPRSLLAIEIAQPATSTKSEPEGAKVTGAHDLEVAGWALGPLDSGPPGDLKERQRRRALQRHAVGERDLADTRKRLDGVDDLPDETMKLCCGRKAVIL